MMVDVEMAIYHYHFMVRSYKRPLGITEDKIEYYTRMKDAIVSEIRLMVVNNDHNVYNSVLSMYMGSDCLADFVDEVFSTKDMLTQKVVYLAWNQGNSHIIQRCIEMGVDTKPQKNVSCAIRSGCTDVLDICVGMGACLDAPLFPYRHCRSVKMVNHIYVTYGCRLYDMARKLPGPILVSSQYLLLGGHIEEMGGLNEKLRKQGNEQRSLPIKGAYIRSLRKDREELEELEGLGRALLLPGFVVKKITEYI